jgi:hypothetical protein
VELEAVPEMKAPGRFVDQFPAFGKVRNDFAGVIAGDEATHELSANAQSNVGRQTGL